MFGIGWSDLRWTHSKIGQVTEVKRKYSKMKGWRNVNTIESCMRILFVSFNSGMFCLRCSHFQLAADPRQYYFIFFVAPKGRSLITLPASYMLYVYIALACASMHACAFVHALHNIIHDGVALQLDSLLAFWCLSCVWFWSWLNTLFPVQEGIWCYPSWQEFCRTI